MADYIDGYKGYPKTTAPGIITGETYSGTGSGAGSHTVSQESSLIHNGGFGRFGRDVAPRCMSITLDGYDYAEHRYHPLETLVFQFDGKKYEAKMADVFEAILSSGLFKVVD